MLRKFTTCLGLLAIGLIGSGLLLILLPGHSYNAFQQYAALSTATVWEVRQAGTDTNGGGFVKGASGTDYSLNNNKNASGCTSCGSTTNDISVTDGVTAGTTTITSATANFTTAIIGNIIYVSGGTGSITASWYQVTARGSATSITVDRSTGLTTGTGVTLNIGGSLGTWGQALSNMTIGSVAQQVVFIKNDGTYSNITSTITAASGANDLPNVSPNYVIGYNTTRGDNPTGTSRPTLSSASAINMVTVAMNNVVFANLIIDGTSVANRGFNITASNAERNLTLENVFVKNVQVTCADITASVGAPKFHDFECTNVTNAANNAGIKIGSGGAICLGCYIHGNKADGIGGGANAYVVVMYSIFDSNRGTGGPYSGITVALLSNSVIAHSIFYNQDGAGFKPATYMSADLMDNIFDSNGTYGIQMPASLDGNLTSAQILPAKVDYNAFRANTTNARTNIQAGPHDVTLTVDPFVSSSTGNFAINNTAGGGAALKAVGWPGAFPAGLSTGTPTIGAVIPAGSTCAQRVTMCGQ